MSNDIEAWVADAIVEIDVAYKADLTNTDLIAPADLAIDAARRLQKLGYNAMCYEWFQAPVLAVAGHRLIKVWWSGKP